MAYPAALQTKIQTFINKAQTKLGQNAVFIADKISRNARYDSYRDEAELGFELDCFVRALDNTWNNWTNEEIEQLVERWNARISGPMPYFNHTQYNFNIRYTS